MLKSIAHLNMSQAISIFTNGIQSYKLIELPLARALPHQFNMTDVSLIWKKKCLSWWNSYFEESLNTKKCKSKNKKCKRTFALAPKRGKISITGLISLTDHKSNVESFMFQELLGFANKQVCYNSQTYCSLAQETYDMLSSKGISR